jgi:hypothetical protein
MSQQYKFYKTEENRWYIDLPEWKGSQADLEMVAGADKMLDILSENGDQIKIEVDDDYTNKNNTHVTLVLDKKHPQILGGGADYYWGEEKIWLCDVTKFVFGYFPKYINFKIVNEQLR